MRVRLQGWFRSITLVPWYEVEGLSDADAVRIGVGELRALIAEQPGVASSLRALVHELGAGTGLGHLDDEQLVARVAELITRGQLRVELELRVPMASDEVEFVGVSEYEPAPVTIAESDDHWVEVELLDESGEPVVGELCRITLPDDRELLQRTDRNGLVRVDRSIAGSCTICFPELDAGATAPLTGIDRQGVQTSATGSAQPSELHWVEVELLGEDGRGVAGELCKITLPNGKKLIRRTDAQGLIRLASLAEAGDCKFSFLDLDATAWGADVPELLPGRSLGGEQGPTGASADERKHWFEVGLIGEDGVGIADALCEITLADGTVLEQRTDGSGLVRIEDLDEAADYEVCFPELDADAWDVAG